MYCQLGEPPYMRVYTAGREIRAGPPATRLSPYWTELEEPTLVATTRQSTAYAAAAATSSTEKKE